MPSTRDLRRRIKSVKNTAQITKAMQMVSATKMRRAQNQAIAGRPYSSTLSSVLSQVSGKVNFANVKLLNSNGSSKVGVLILTSDKGLCGALNTNVLRKLQTFTAEKTDFVFFTIGRKGRDFLVRTGKDLVADFENPEKVQFADAVKLRKFLIESFLKEEVGEIYILFPDFVSTLKQEPKLIKLLPISIEESIVQNENTKKDNSEFLYEPNPAAVLDYALVHELDTLIYQGMLETKASEHSARMIAMQNATNNAKDLVADLTLAYNQIRQSAITTELLEITSAQLALE